MTPDGGRARSWSARLYRLLLRTYARPFRERHGVEMERLFLEKRRDARRRGRMVDFLVGATLDAIRNGLGSRWEEGRRASPGPDDGRRREGTMMDGLWRDSWHAARSLRRSPGFTMVAIVTIALGIGANTAIFSVVRAVLLAPLPYDEPEELVMLWGELRARGVTHFPFSPPDFREIADGASRLDGLAAVFSFQQALTGDGDPVEIDIGAVTWDLFDLLGVQPALGRGFMPDDDVPNPPGVFPGGPGAAPAVALLSDGLWDRRFGRDPDVVGRTLEIAGVPAEVVGVMRPGFELHLSPTAQVPPDVDVWVTARADYANAPDNNVFLRAIGRLADGATHAQAQDEVARIASEMADRSDVKRTAGWGVRVEPLAADLTAHVRPTLLALFGAVVFVLLIACANVANLLLVRAQTRTRELAVLSALGGSRGRIARRLLLESGILALGGAALGVLLARFGIEALLALQPADLPRAGQVGLDATVLGFTLATTLGAAAVFGLLPAVRASRVDLARSLKGGGGSDRASAGNRLRRVVVVGEVALSLVLLVGAGLMVRSFVSLSRLDPGFEPRGVLAFRVALPAARYPDPAERSGMMATLQERLASIPGVTAVSGGFSLPLESIAFSGRYGPEDALSNPEAFGQADYRAVLPGYFEAMGTEVLEGRVFSEEEHRDSTAVVVIDDVLARTLWPEGSAVGQRFLVRPLTPEPEWVEVVGVVEHQRAHTLAADGPETVYFTDRYLGSFASSWLVRAGVDPLSVADEVRAAVRSVDPAVPVAELRLFEDDVRTAMAPTRFALTLITIFGALALVLAAVGLYGVLAFVVQQRTAEIGVRMAFGAVRGEIQRMVVREGVALAVVGVALGAVVAWPLTGALESMLVGVSATDPLTFVTASVGFLLVAAAACWIPARRATRVDPVVALRAD